MFEDKTEGNGSGHNLRLRIKFIIKGERFNDSGSVAHNNERIVKLLRIDVTRTARNVL